MKSEPVTPTAGIERSYPAKGGLGLRISGMKPDGTRRTSAELADGLRQIIEISERDAAARKQAENN